jgi:hypothetical protein
MCLVDLDQADLLSLGHQVLDGLVRHLGARAHDDDDLLRLGMAEVVEEVVLAPGHAGEVVHAGLHQVGAVLVEEVAGLPRLEEGVGVLRRAAHHRALRREGAGAVGRHQVVADELAQILVVEELDLGDLVRGAEAVEEVEEGDAALQAGALGNGREVVGLLDRGAGDEPEAGLAHRHDVGVVAEDREGMGGDGAGADVHAHGRQLTGDLVHVGDHEQQPLRRREGRRQGAGLQRAVDRARGASLGLHLGDGRHGAPDVLLPLRRPLVGPFPHVGGRGDWIDGDHLVDAVGDRRHRLVAVHRDHSPLRHSSSRIAISPGRACAARLFPPSGSCPSHPPRSRWHFSENLGEGCGAF